ncbi:MAG TPA: potassium/proton antiporter [Candidatus Kapabacteria bacterium]|nr:potassium/proton antiporter [Candidatus Kapabacteria bacterium]
MIVQVEVIFLVLSILFFLSILAGKASSKFGVPALLLFLAVGMMSGSDGIGIEFDNFNIAQAIGTIALSIILYSGGMDTSIAKIKPIIKQGVLLASVGVILTTLVTGLLIWWVLDYTFPILEVGLLASLLLASTMASTDSASVFSILRSKGLNLKNNLRPMLELESGSNDPMAYILVITLIEIIKVGGYPDILAVSTQLIVQLLVGAVAGYAIGRLTVFTMNKIHIGNDSLYPVLIFTFCMFTFSATYFLGGNGFLAVYISGLVVGNSKFVHKRTSLNFFDGLAWMFQLLMFLTLGLLVNPHELIPIALPGLIISLLLIFVARPLTVFITLLPFTKMSFKDKTYISWVGLRGAVPIIFAILPLAEGIPHAKLLFNIVFFCTLISLLLQGTTLPIVAKWLNLTVNANELSKLKEFDVDFSNDIKSVMTEIEINGNILQHGDKLMDLKLPDKTLAVMVKRDGKYFVPTGKTLLNEKDNLLIITDNQEALVETYKNLGIQAK